MRRIAWTLSIAAALLATFSCAPSDLGSTCRFQGDDSKPCGTCIAKSCQSKVDSCCADSVCLDFISPLDTCGNGGACNGIQLASATLASCIASACSDVCVIDATSTTVPDASTPTKDAGPAFTSDCFDDGLDGCTCSPTGGSSKTCTSTSVAVEGHDGFCCADPDWPTNKRSFCECHPFTCEQVSTSNGLTSVRCDTRDFGQHQFTGRDTYCCTGAGSACECGPENICDASQRVTECSVDTASCGSRARVDSCSY